MAKALRYVGRIVAVVALLGAVVMLALMIITRTRAFNRIVRDKLTSYLAANYRGEIDLARIEGSLWGTVTLYGISVRYHGEEVVNAPQVSVSYSLIPLLWRAVHIQAFAYDPTLRLSRDHAGRWNLLEAFEPKHLHPAGPLAVTIHIDSSGIRNGSIDIAPSGLAGKRYELTNLALETNLIISRRGIKIDLRRLESAISALGFPRVRADVSLTYEGRTAPPILRVASARLAMGNSAITLTGLVRQLQAINLDARIVIEKIAAADVRHLYPRFPLLADVTGNITVRGPENALHADVALAARGSALTGSADSDVTQKAPPYAIKARLAKADIQTIMRISGVAGLVDATLEAQGNGLDLSPLKAKAKVRGRQVVASSCTLGNVDLKATVASQALGLSGISTGPGGQLNLNSSSDLSANPHYRLTLTARHLNIAKAHRGAARPTELNFSTTVDGRGLKPGTMEARVATTATRSSVGRVTIDRGIVDVKISGGRAEVARAHFEAEQSTADVHGTTELAYGAPLRIAYTIRSASVARWLTLVGLKGNGKLAVDGTLNGPPTALGTRGKIAFDLLQMGGSAIHHGEIRYDGVATGEAAPYGSIVATLDGVSAGAELDHLNAAMSVARGARHPGSLTINARDSSGRGHRLVADFSYLPQSVSVRLTELTLGLPDGTWRLAASAKFDTTPDAIAVDELQMINGRRQLTLEGNLGRRGTQNFRIIASQLDLRSFNPLARQGRKFDGVVSANVRVNGAASAPLIDAMLNANQVRVNDQLIGEVSATLRYQAGRATIDATARQDVQDQVTVQGTIPVAFEWAQGFKAKLSGDTDLKITSARLNLKLLDALAPGKVRDFEGLAAIDLILRGPVMQPTLNGSIRLAGVKGEIVPLGVKVSEMHARIEIDERAMRVVSLAAESGNGTINGAGAIMLHDYSATAVQLKVKFNRWPAIDTREYQATIGGNLAMDGTLDAPRVHGQIEVLNGTIHPDLAFLTASTPLAPDETITVIQPGQHDQVPGAAMSLTAPALPPRPQVQPTRFNKLAMDVMVLIHRNTWIRHQNAVAELDGHLHIVKQPERPVTVVGEVNTLRGWLGYQNKRFTLETGHVTFAGGPQIDPMLDIDARYTLPNYIIDVVVGGTAKKPTIQLKSQPDLAQADILSLLLFGKTTGTLNQGQQASLQQNAARMATGFAASQVSQAVSNSLGLESIGVELSDISGTGGRIGFGRYLGENTYISASQTVGTTQNQQDRGQKISVQYFITRWLSVTTSNSTNGSREVDLTISKQF